MLVGGREAEAEDAAMLPDACREDSSDRSARGNSRAIWRTAGVVDETECEVAVKRPDLDTFAHHLALERGTIDVPVHEASTWMCGPSCRESRRIGAAKVGI